MQATLDNLTAIPFVDRSTYEFNLRLLTYTDGSAQLNYHVVKLTRHEAAGGRKAACKSLKLPSRV